MSVSVAFDMQKTTALILSLCFSKKRLPVPVEFEHELKTDAGTLKSFQALGGN